MSPSFHQLPVSLNRPLEFPDNIINVGFLVRHFENILHQSFHPPLYPLVCIRSLITENPNLPSSKVARIKVDSPQSQRSAAPDYVEQTEKKSGDTSGLVLHSRQNEKNNTNNHKTLNKSDMIESGAFVG